MHQNLKEPVVSEMSREMTGLEEGMRGGVLDGWGRQDCFAKMTNLSQPFAVSLNHKPPFFALNCMVFGKRKATAVTVDMQAHGMWFTGYRTTGQHSSHQAHTHVFANTIVEGESKTAAGWQGKFNAA